MKKVISLLICLLMCVSFSATASAQTVSASVAQPYYEMTSIATSELVINGTTATCRSTIRGFSDVTKITAEQYLEKNAGAWFWGTYDNAAWIKTVYSNVLAMSNTKTGLTSGKYRLKTIFKLTDKNGKTENITVYSDVKVV